MMVVLLSAIDPTLGVLVAGLASAVGAYLVAARKMSGAVRSSDAEQLWAESRSIREWSSDRITDLSTQIAHLEGRIQAMEAKNRELMNERDGLLETIDELRHNYIECRAEATALHAQLEDALAQLKGIDARRKREEG